MEGRVARRFDLAGVVCPVGNAPVRAGRVEGGVAVIVEGIDLANPAFPLHLGRLALCPSAHVPLPSEFRIALKQQFSMLDY
jgi:hypothetical protein